MAETGGGGPGQKASVEAGLGSCCLAQVAPEADKTQAANGPAGVVGSFGLWGKQKINKDELGAEANGPGGFVPATRVCRPGTCDNNTAIGVMGCRGEGTSIWAQPRR